MKKRILLLGALVGAFLLASCSGGNKKQVVSSATPEELDDASKVINYYHTSLIVLRHVARTAGIRKAANPAVGLKIEISSYSIG